MNSSFPIYMVMGHCGQAPEMAFILHPLIAGWPLTHFDQSLWSKQDTNRILISVFMWGLLSCLAWNSACETTHLTVERGATCLKPRSQLRCRTIHKCIALPATLRPMRDTSHLPANYQEDHTCMRKPQKEVREANLKKSHSTSFHSYEICQIHKPTETVSNNVFARGLKEGVLGSLGFSIRVM